MKNKIFLLMALLLIGGLQTVSATYADVNITVELIPTISNFSYYEKNDTGYFQINTTILDYTDLKIITETSEIEYIITKETNKTENQTFTIWREIACQEDDLLNISKKLINLTESSANCRGIYLANGRLSEALRGCSEHGNPFCYNQSLLYDECDESKQLLILSKDNQITTLERDNDKCRDNTTLYVIVVAGIVGGLCYTFWKKPFQPSKHPDQKDFPDMPG